MSIIGSVLRSDGNIVEKNEKYFIGLIDSNDQLEIRDCTVLEIRNKACKVQIDGIKNPAIVSVDILEGKKRNVNRAIKLGDIYS